MELVCHPPYPPLSQWVELIWHYESAPVPFALEKLMPTGRVDLIINLQDEALRIHDPTDVNRIEHYRGPLLSGVHGTYTIIDASQQTRIMGVAFKPGGAHALLGFSVAEISDAHLGLESIWASGAALLWEELALAPDAWSRIRILERALLRQIQRRKSGELHPAIQMALEEFHQDPASISIQALAKWGNLSSRRFIELFTRQVGITPKLYGRILRFQHVLKRVHASSNMDWCGVAFDAGYYDQSHLIRDFQQFSGLSPTAYRALSTAHHNHVAMGDER